MIAFTSGFLRYKKSILFRKANVLLALLIITFSEVAYTQEVWLQKSNIATTKRAAAVCFSIGNKAYVGTGLDQNSKTKRDFWEYDQNTNTWTQVANYGGGSLWAGVGFSIGDKGYVVCGGDASGNSTNKLYEYDPAKNVWTQKQSFSGEARVYATGFSINSKGYIGTGYTDVNGQVALNDFWEYDPNDVSNGLDANGNPNGKWSQKANYPSNQRAGAVSFSIMDKGYICTGENSSSFFNDVWEYDPFTDTWVEKTNFGGLARSFAAGFSLGKRGYIGTGETSHLKYANDFWEYDPFDNSNGFDVNGNPNGKWTRKTDFGGVVRGLAFGFSTQNRGYIGAGFDNGYSFVESGGDLWEFEPKQTTISEQSHRKSHTFANPNPFRGSTNIILGTTLDDAQLFIYNLLGEKVNTYEHIYGHNFSIELNSQPAGIYYFTLIEKSGATFNGKLILMSTD
jgi:hypothetical protein